MQPVSLIQNIVSSQMGWVDTPLDALADSRELVRFLNEPDTMDGTVSTTLQLDVKKMSNNDKNIQSTSNDGSSKESSQRSNANYIMLSKIKPAIINQDTISLVRFTPLETSPLSALYHSIHSVFGPMLKGQQMPSKLENILSELDENLASSLNQGQDSFIHIHSFDDEYDYWASKSLAREGNDKSQSDRALFFMDAFKPLKSDFAKFHKLSVEDFCDTVEKIQDSLDEVWRQQMHSPYPQARMEHLIHTIIENIMNSMQSKVPDISNVDSVAILRAAIEVCDGLISVLDTLTSKIWPNTSANKWIGEPVKGKWLESVSNRLGSILEIRQSHDLLIQLLVNDEPEDSNPFSAFNNLNLLDNSLRTEKAWQNAQEMYADSMASLELKAGQRLVLSLGRLQSQPKQYLIEFQKYRNLLARPSIARQLDTELKILLTQLISSFKLLQASLKDRTVQFQKGRNVSQTIGSIIWARQQLHRIEEADATVVFIVQKANYESISSAIYDELRSFEREQFEFWVEDTIRLIEDQDGLVTLQKSGRLMELDFQSGKLNVNYGDHLVTLIREARQLVAMGFAIPAIIQQTADVGQQFFRHGVVLKQVANFYNHIDQQMLPCQQGMMLVQALDFERIVKNPKGSSASNGEITWDEPKELESFISKLQVSADNLTSENRKLRKFHTIILDQVLKLMGVDLIKNQSKWKEILNSIRTSINTAYENGLNHGSTLAWRNHWDYQLYKSLEYQYRLGLEDLHEQLPEIKIDLVFKQQKLQFRPSFEEVRAKYYREMKKMINMPTLFKGLGETTIFTQLVDTNSQSLLIVYNLAENLFQRLGKVQDLFTDWIVLGTVDLDDFVQEALDDVADWEMNFRVVKQKGKEAEQLPLSVKIDCITVSTAPVKATIDDHLQRLFDALLSALRNAINTHIKSVEEFISMAMDMLLKRPQTMEEIGFASTRHEELSKNKYAIQTHFEAADAKNKLLKSVAGSGVDTTLAKTKWGKLELMLESHELMINEQVDMLKGAIDGRINTFNDEIEKFSLRWYAMKPDISDMKRIENAQNAITFIKERVTELDDILKTKLLIMDDCAHFGSINPDFAVLRSLEDDIKVTQEIWFLCEEYNEGLEELSKQDWITFRRKIGSLDDFFMSWSERVNSRKIDMITTYIIRDIDSYRHSLPFFKFLRGDNWMSEHWGEVFRLLQLPKGIILSELTVRHFLDVRSTIEINIEKIKDLNNRANGEIAIRDALQELDIWGTSATFALTEYQDAKGGKIQIIKEWKETLAQVGDSQSLLQSLKDSPYFKNFAEKAGIWEQKLSDVDDYLRQINAIQRKWVYLEPIFSRGSLPSEYARFCRIDEDFRSIMSNIASDHRIVSIVAYHNIRSTLASLGDQLERSQKALNEFLEEKRTKFARFYFLGDEDLLEILGQATNPQVIQTHLKKLFAGVNTVQFDLKVQNIISMKSIHGELVQLKNSVRITDQVEVWLHEFAQEMKNTLQILLRDCIFQVDIFKYPTETICLAEYIHFTANVEKVLNTTGDFSNLLMDLREQLDTFTAFDTYAIEEKSNREVMELKLKSLILDVIHFVEVVVGLQNSKVKSVNDWVWRKQLRFYMDTKKICKIQMHDADFEYSYEYQGIPPKLVHTSLTDKCYLTLTQAMSAGFGAGTGKTESVKALGALFGRQVLVFNCDEGIDYKSMGRIFVGIVKCGAWGCFDEFNRLDEAVLSAVSQQIQVIQDALKKKELDVVLLGKSVQLDSNSGIFVTLNPAGKGYGGRQKLPDNLKQLFRSVAMTHPENDRIAEGFKLGEKLGRKVVSIFMLSKQFLSHQQHYDWGLRALKAILGLAGKLLHQEKRGGPISTFNEEIVIVKAVTGSILSKLTFDDSHRFKLLVKDLFPDVDITEILYEQLEIVVKEAYKELGLIYVPSQAEKVFQLYETCQQRMGVVLVGPSGSGKNEYNYRKEYNLAIITTRMV